MNDNSLDSFEQGLLTELRSEVAERGHDRRPAPTRRRLKVATSAVAATGVAVVGGLLLRPDGAFAVEDRDNGDVAVTITELSDADGLEDALADRGISADVTYRDGGMIEGSVDDPLPPVEDGSQAGGATTHQKAESGSPSKAKRGGPADSCALTVKMTDDGVTFIVDGDAVDPEKTLVIDLAGSKASASMVAVSWTGPGCTV